MSEQTADMLGVLLVFGWMFLFAGCALAYGLMWVVVAIYQIYHILRYGKQA